MSSLFHWEWLVIELAVVGWAVWELVSLRRYKQTDAKPPVDSPDRPG